MSTEEKCFGERERDFRDRLTAEDREIRAINMCGDQWYIEIVSLLHGVTKVGTGFFYKCNDNDITLKFFEGAKERGISEKGDTFMLLLRRSNRHGDNYDSVGITKKHFEQITGLKALTTEEYYQKCESVPMFTEIGATLIDLSKLR